MLIASLALEGHQNLTWLCSGLLISKTFLPYAGRSCTLLFCLYLLSCTQKMHGRVYSLADTVPPLLVTLQFSSELGNSWGTGLSSLLDSSVRLLYFHICFSASPSCVHNYCVMDHTYHSHMSFVLPHFNHYVTIPPESWLPYFQASAFPF